MYIQSLLHGTMTFNFLPFYWWSLKVHHFMIKPFTTNTELNISQCSAHTFKLWNLKMSDVFSIAYNDTVL